MGPTLYWGFDMLKGKKLRQELAELGFELVRARVHEIWRREDMVITIHRGTRTKHQYDKKIMGLLRRARERWG